MNLSHKKWYSHDLLFLGSPSMSLILRLQYGYSANGTSTKLSQETTCASSRLQNQTGQADDLENNKQIVSGFSDLKTLTKIL